MEEGCLAKAGVAVAYLSLREKESRTVKAHRRILGGEDMQTDHTHVTAQRGGDRSALGQEVV